MVTRTRLFLVILIGLWSLQARAQEPVTIGVMEFKAAGGVPQDKANALLEVLAEEISSLGNIQVVTRTDIKSMLDLQKLKRLAGCSDEECFAEISGALGMRWAVIGSIALFGKIYLLNLKLMDARGVMVVGRVSRRIRGGEEELLEELPEAARELFERVADRLGLAVPERVTVAARYPQPLSQSPSAVWVITREDIEATGADSVPNLLRLVPGMNVIVSTNTLESITSRLQWTHEGNHYLVLVDGREVNFDPLGFPPWGALPIFLEDIERIEVIRGPASALYGANAFAGIVSITTREMPERTTARVLTRAGEVGWTTASLHMSTKLGDWGFAGSGGVELAGESDNPSERSKRVWKARALVEKRLSGSSRLLIDMGMASLEGPAASPIGTVWCEFAPVSVRLAYESQNLSGQLYWIYAKSRAQIDTPLEYAGTHLATFLPAPQDFHVVDGQIQWKPPRFWEPLLLVVGGGGRVSWGHSDHMLDADTFADPASPRYHQPGINPWEIRSGAFVHAEYAMADWITVTGGTRIDYNTQTQWFVSPRLAAVLNPAADHFLRVGVARSFRKPSFLETISHLMVEFPEGSPIQGSSQNSFQEFMTRVGGNTDLDNEELLAFEAGYLGRFMDGRLTINLDLYYNRYRNQITMIPNVIEDEQGLPDLHESSFMFQNEGPDPDSIGGELSIRFNPSRNLAFLFSWSHRQIFDHAIGGYSSESPKNLFTLGGRFRTDGGLLGSFYIFTRSEFRDTHIENPAGILQPLLNQSVNNAALFMGRLGWMFELGKHGQVEAGFKLFLPVSLSPFSYHCYDGGGGITPNGRVYGARQLGRVLTGYLEGSF
jgi:outer membrane receptor protein involved in Fe transport